MKHSTLYGNKTICLPVVGNQIVRISMILFLTFLFGSLSIISSNAQSLSNNPEFVFDGDGSDAITQTMPSTPCLNADVIEDGDWIETNSTQNSDFDLQDHSFIIGQSPSSCTNTIWTGGYLGATPNVHISEQEVTIPSNGIVELCFEYLSILVDENEEGDYSYISIDGTEVFVLEHLTENDTEGFVEYCVDLTAYAGQTVMLAVGNVHDADDSQGNVFFGCFEFSCPGPVIGCTDSLACNFNPQAEEDDGSCMMDDECGECGGNGTAGCNDDYACNFDPAADCNDGSCEYDSCMGCTDLNACNFDSSATMDDGSCDYSCFGCTDSSACNFDSAASVDDGSCDFSCYGCTDSSACNFDSGATMNDGSCTFPGCTNPEANNYDSTAGCDNGLCDFSSENDDCDHAEILNCGDVVTGTTTGNTVADVDFCGTSSTAPGVWYVLEGNNSYVTVSTCSDYTNYDTKLTVFEGFCDELTCVGGNDDDFSCASSIFNSSIFDFEATSGNLYYILVHGFDDGNGDFELSVTCTPMCDPEMTIECPGDVDLECSDSIDPLDIGVPVIDASDCVDGIELSFSDDVISSEECTSTIARTWVATAGDLTAMCTQIITLTDMEGPVFEDFDEIIEVSCLEEVPGPADLTAFDECSEMYVDVESFESHSGFLTDTCELTTAFGPGDDWALWLPTLSEDGLVSSANFHFDANGGSFEQYLDGTARMFGTVVNDVNSNESFVVDFWFENKADWTTWSDLGRSYKDDMGCAQPDLYEAWTYYELVNGFSTLTGQDDLAGDILYFQHMPSNYYFGFQIGEGANNKNCDYGMSGWFTYNGMVDGQYVDGHGDVNVDAECGEYNETDCANETEFTYLYRAEDDCTNATIVSQTIIVSDETGPEFTVFPEDVTVDCDDYPVEIATVEAVDNCVGEVEILDPVDELFPGECDHSFVVERTWGAIDICGNRTDRTQTITVIDEEAPVMVGLPENVTVECDDLPEVAEVTVSDNCSELANIIFTFEETTEEGNCVGNYTIYRTWYAEDECGNSDEYTQEITVQDTTAPVITGELEIDLPCDNFEGMYAEATDNCSGVAEFYYEDDMVSGGCAGNVIRTYFAIDGCGNVADFVQIIHLIDDVAPEFTAFPADATVECDEVPGVQTDEIEFSDNCTEVTLTFDGEERIDGDCDYNYTLIRTWTITDNCDNSTTASQTITVQDTTAPEFTFVPQDNEYSCEETVPNTNAEASDNCGDVIVTFEDEIIDGNCPQSFTIVRTFTATDECENSSTAVQNIYVYDNTAPEFTLVGADMTLECDEVVPAPEAEATDNCDTDVQIDVDEDMVDGDCPNTYVLTRTYTATDDCGNSSTATQVITVVDTTAPVFDEYEFYTAIECDEVEDYILTASDNCGETTVEIIEEVLNSGGCMGVLWRHYEATDECGNSTIVEQFITVTDTTDPILVDVPADETLECDEVSMGDDGYYFGMGDVYGEDNCALDVEVTYSEEMVPGLCANSYQIIRTWVAIDYCENEATASQTVTVEDTTNPEFVEFPADVTVECSDDLPTIVYPVAIDNCDDLVEIELTEETEDGDCEGEYTLLRIFRAFDNCGNQTIQVQTISIVDTTAPEFTFVPESATFECNTPIDVVMAEADDNCSSATITFEDGDSIEGDCPQAYSFVRTFTATDDCGNSSTATQDIFVVDTTAPVVTGEIEIDLPCDDYEGIYAEATDNCGAIVEFWYEDDLVSGGCAGNVLRTYFATDECGNTGDFLQIIHLTDEVAPEFTAFPADATVECDDVPGVQTEEIDFSDNCTDVTLTYDGEERIDGDCDYNYTLIRTWTITDNCDNSTSQSQTITVQDTTAPEFTFVPEDNEYSCEMTIPNTNAEASDNCGDVTVTFEDAIIDGNCPQAYTIVRTFTATDECENSSTAVQNIYVYDNTAPEFTFVAADVTIECDQDIPAADASASDNCDLDVEITVEEEMIEGNCPQAYSIVRTYTATDDCGNASTATQTITVEDTTAPVITAELEIDLPCDDYEGMYAEATDNCGEVVEFYYEEDFVSGGCAGNIIRTYFATDECGNTSDFMQIIHLTDEVAPEFTAFPADVTVECDNVPSINEGGEAGEGFTGDYADGNWTLSYDGGDGSINITESSMTITGDDSEMGGNTQATATCGAGGTYTFSWDYLTTDEDGASYDPAFYVNGEQFFLSDDFGGDSQSGEMTLDCAIGDVIGFGVNSTDGAFGAATLTITNFTYEGSVAIEFTDNCTDVTLTYDGEERIDGDCDYNYTLIRTWTITDNCENSTSQSQTITVEDTTAPEFTFVPQDMEYSCEETIADTNAEASDNCGDVTVTFEDAIIDGDCPQSYTIVRTFTATDECENSSTAVQNIFVYDNTAPEFTSVAADVTIECDEVIPAADASASDNCDLDVEITVEEEMIEGNCPQAYSIVRTYTATDDCGNASTATQTVTVEDTTAPVITAELEIDLPCDDYEGMYAEATDNCGEVVEFYYEEDFVSGGCAGNIIRTYFATDECGNTSDFMQIIHLTDEVAPVFTAFPADATVECDDVPGVQTEEIDYSDNCTDVTLTYDGEERIDGDCDYNYTLVRTWTITDNCENSTSMSQTITVQDTTAPEFTFVPQDMEYSCEETIADTNAEASDNCGDVTVTFEDAIIDGDCPQSYTIVRTFTATDECENSSNAVQNIFVYDNTAPEFTSVAADVTIECDEAIPAADASASDNCDLDVEITVEEEMIEGNCPQAYSIVRTYTATDDCGNASTATQTVTIEDTTAPVITAELELDLPCDDYEGNFATALDNCGDVTLTHEDEFVSGGCAGNVIRTYFATDECGNTSDFMQIIHLTDDVAPELSNVPADMDVECGDEIPAPADVTATDNCDDNLVVVLSEETVDNDCLYSIVRTWTVTDHCDNTTSASQTITIIDTLAPQFEAENDEYTVSCDEPYYVELPEAYDVCDQDVTVTDDMEIIDGACANEYTEIHTFIATDDCGNSASITLTINVEDNDAPEFTYVPSGNEISCDVALPTEEAEATDNCGDVTVTFEDEIIDGNCPQSYIVVRTWTATDACDNSSTATTEYYVYDNTAPTFDQEVEDVVVECADDAPAIAELTATDNCGIATVTMSSDVEVLDDCGNSITYVSYIAEDECGNYTETGYTITVNDVTAPEFDMEVEDLVLDCEDEVPAPADVTATDNCDSDVQVEMTEEFLGDAPVPGSIADCNLTTPVSPYYNPDWSLWLQEFANGDEFYVTVEAQFVEFPDGTAHLTGEVVSTENATAGWAIDVWFMDGMDWADWSNQGFPTSYKDDFGLAADEYMNWTYYIFNATSSTLTGLGDYAGSLINLSHAPANFYYGYQVGVAANNANGEYGNGGWFNYDGVLVEDGIETEVDGAGDFAFDADCCPQYEIVRTWTATDCSGNQTSVSQVISFEDLEEAPTAKPEVQYADYELVKGDADGNTVVSYPNPAAVKSTIMFNMVEEGKTIVEVFNLAGIRVATLYNDKAEANVDYRVIFDATDMADGVYIYKVMNGNTVLTDRIIITK